MRRKWIILTVSFLVLIMIAAGVAGFWLLKNRGFRAIRRAEAAYAQSNWPEAKRQYAWYLARQPDDVDALHKYAEVCQKVIADRRGALRSAGQAYFRIAVLRESDRDAALRAAQFCEEHELWDDLQYCSNYFARRYQYDPSDPTSIDASVAPFVIWTAKAEEGQGNIESARLKYEKLIANFPECPPQVFGSLASILRQQGLDDLALSALEDGLKRYPEDARMYVERARYFLYEQQLDDAEREIENALNLSSGDADVQCAAAWICVARRKWDRAREYATAAMEQGLNVEVIRALARINFEQNAIDETAKLLESADPYFVANNPELYHLQGETQIDLGRYDDVEKTIETYRRAYPEHAAVQDYLVVRRALSEAEPADADYAETIDNAVDQLKVVTQRAPNFAQARLELVVAYLRKASNEADAPSREELRTMAKGLLIAYLEANPGDMQGRRVWEQSFAEPTLEKAWSEASEALDDPNATPQELTQLSERLLQAAAENGAEGRPSEENMKTARDALERAFREDPSLEQTFKTLIAVYVELGDADSLKKAREAIGQAEEQGTDKHVLRMATALLLLRADDASVNGAVSEMMEDIGSVDLSQEELADWSEVFVQYGQGARYAQTLRAYLDGETDDERRLLFQTELVRTARMSGDYMQALELAEGLRAAVQHETSGMKILIDETCMVVDGLISSGNAEGTVEAQEALNWVLDQDPDNSRALKSRVRLHINESNLAAAESLLQKLRSTAPEDREVFMLSAEVAIRQGETRRQLEFLRQALSTSPADIQVQLLLAQAHMMLKEYDDSITILEGLRTSRPNDTLLLNMLARSYAGAGRVNDASVVVSYINAITTNTPETQRLLASLRAWVAFCREDWTEVEQLAAGHWEGPPANIDLLRLLVASLAQQGRQSEAEQLLIGAASTLKTREIYTEVARWYLAKGDEDSINEASSWFTRAQMVTPGYLPALLGMIEIEARKNSFGRAIGLCDRYLQNSPDNVEILQRKAFLLAQSNELEKAIEVCTTAMSIAEREELFFLRGSMLLVMDKIEESIADIQRSVELNGEASAAADAMLAEAFLKLSEPDYSLARAHYEAALEKRNAGQPVDPKRLEWIAKELSR